MIIVIVETELNLHRKPIVPSNTLANVPPTIFFLSLVDIDLVKIEFKMDCTFENDNFFWFREQDESRKFVEIDSGEF